jgi:hypothetical protein
MEKRVGSAAYGTLEHGCWSTVDARYIGASHRLSAGRGLSVEGSWVS